MLNVQMPGLDCAPAQGERVCDASSFPTQPSKLCSGGLVVREMKGRQGRQGGEREGGGERGGGGLGGSIHGIYLRIRIAGHAGGRHKLGTPSKPTLSLKGTGSRQVGGGCIGSHLILISQEVLQVVLPQGVGDT